MFPKTVVCLNGETLQGTLTLIKEAEKTDIPLFEIRVDYLQPCNLNYHSLKIIRNSSDRKMIFTLRKKSEGGNAEVDENLRKRLFLYAISLGFNYIDVEYSSSKELVSLLLEKKASSSMILSYHNFERTDQNDIEAHYKVMSALGPDIIKIVTMAQSEEDNLVVKEILKKYVLKFPALTCFCMGRKGKASRFTGYVMGNALTYLALNEESATTSGQLTYKEFLEK